MTLNILSKLHNDYVEAMNQHNIEKDNKIMEIEISKRNNNRLIQADEFFDDIAHALDNDFFDINMDEELLNLDTLILRRSVQ